MKSRTRVIVTVAFGSLIALTALAGWEAYRRASAIYSEIASLHETYREGERILDEIQSEIHLSGIYVRDYLLDPSHISGGFYREQLLALRSAMHEHLGRLRTLAGKEDAGKLDSLRAELDSYWDSLEPLFTWSPQQKMALSALFLRRQILPRRDAVLEVAREVRALNEAHLDRQKKAVEDNRRQFQRDLLRLVAAAVVLGLVVAAVSVARLSSLERRAEDEHRRSEQAERELRRLSHQLVQAQEEERKSISRELHDEVGQMLTGLRVQLAGLAQQRAGAEQAFQQRLEECKHLAEGALRAVRDMALGLRPSMLDDLGLAPALEWQARDFSRRFGIPVTVQLEGDLQRLPEAHRTCVYRVVQEALTNCARHAQASSIRIVAHGHREGVSLTIQDDGVGFRDEEIQGRGLGLIGIQERVRELGGAISLFSQPGKGTALTAEIPMLVRAPS